MICAFSNCREFCPYPSVLVSAPVRAPAESFLSPAGVLGQPHSTMAKLGRAALSWPGMDGFLERSSTLEFGSPWGVRGNAEKGFRAWRARWYRVGGGGQNACVQREPQCTPRLGEGLSLQKQSRTFAALVFSKCFHENDRGDPQTKLFSCLCHAHFTDRETNPHVTVVGGRTSNITLYRNVLSGVSTFQ